MLKKSLMLIQSIAILLFIFAMTVFELSFLHRCEYLSFNPVYLLLLVTSGLIVFEGLFLALALRLKAVKAKNR